MIPFLELEIEFSSLVYSNGIDYDEHIELLLENAMPDLRTRMIFAALMSLMMSIIMSGWITWLHIGFKPDFAGRWLHAFLAAWPAAFFAVILIAPAVQRVSMKVSTALR